MSTSNRLLLFTGMTPDDRIFREQRAAIPGLHVVPWLSPQRDESIGAFAKRTADSLAIDQPCFVGGVSFGGIVALEVACLLPVRACFLISSIRSPVELPPSFRAARWLAPLGVENVLDGFGRLASQWPRSRRSTTTSRLTKLAGKAGAWHRWATAAVLRWQPNPAIGNLKIYRLHGELDRTFPSRYVQGATLVPSGGHVLPLSHPQTVTNFLIGGMESSARS